MRKTLAILAVLCAVSAGCGGDGGSSGGGLLPSVNNPPVTVSQAPQVPKAAAAADAVDNATQAVTNVILDPFSDGEASGAHQTFLTPASFEFTSHVEFELDLDSEGRNGNDRFPNVSGILLVTVDGLLSGTWLSGEASYSVIIEAGTDIVAVDPDTEIETVIPQGSSWSCALAVTWDITDSQNWMVVGTSTKAVDIDGLTVTDGDQVTTVGVSGERVVTTTVAKADGELTKERTIEGSFTITIDDGANVVNVLIEFDADGLILVTIGDEQFGPFNRQEFREFILEQLAA